MKRPSYSSEFKRETVKYILEHGLSISAASEKFGVGQSALRRWVVEYREDPDQAFPGHGRLRADEEKIRKLTEENKRLQQERDILKKAMAYFAKDVR